MNGQEFFSQNKGNSGKVKLLRQYPEADQLGWELERTSIHSPFVVDSSENIIRSIIDPIHTEGSEIKPTAFDDVFTHGLSVNRESLVSIGSIVEAQLARVDSFNSTKVIDKPARSYVGYVTFSVSLLRSILINNRRQIGVYDTSTNEDVSHAEVCELIGGELAKRSARASIYQMAKNNFTASIA